MPEFGELARKNGEWVVYDGAMYVPLKQIDPQLAQSLQGYTDVRNDAQGNPVQFQGSNGQWVAAGQATQAPAGFTGFGGGASGGKGATGDFGATQTTARQGGHAVDPTEGIVQAEPTPQQVYDDAYKQAKAAGASDDAADQYASGVMNDAVDSGQTGSGATAPQQPTPPIQTPLLGGNTGVPTGGTGGTTGGGNDSGFNPDGSPKHPQLGQTWFRDGKRYVWNGGAWQEVAGGTTAPGFYNNGNGGTTSVGGNGQVIASMGAAPSWWPAGVPWPPVRTTRVPKYDATGLQVGVETVSEPDYDTILSVRKQVQAEGNAADSKAAAEARAKFEQDQFAWEKQKVADAAAARQAQVLAKPETFTDLQGNVYVRTSRDAPWQLQRQTPDINQMMDLALVNGNADAYLQLAQARDDPLGQKRLQTAMQYASSPADYLTVQAMLRGELPTEAQPGGLGRVAPRAGFLQEAAQNYFNAPHLRSGGFGAFASGLRGQPATGGPLPGFNQSTAPQVPGATGQVPGQSEVGTEGTNANIPFPGGGFNENISALTFNPREQPGSAPPTRGFAPSVATQPLDGKTQPVQFPQMGFTQQNGGDSSYPQGIGFSQPQGQQQYPSWMPPAVRSIYQGQPVQPSAPFLRLGGPGFATDQSYRNMLPSERQQFDQTLRLQGIDPTDYEAQRQANKPVAPRNVGALRGFAAVV